MKELKPDTAGNTPEPAEELFRALSGMVMCHDAGVQPIDCLTSARNALATYNEVRRVAAPSQEAAPEVQSCHADRDGDCNWDKCPQLANRQSYCPLASAEEDAEGAEPAPLASQEATTPQVTGFGDWCDSRGVRPTMGVVENYASDRVRRAAFDIKCQVCGFRALACGHNVIWDKVTEPAPSPALMKCGHSRSSWRMECTICGLVMMQEVSFGEERHQHGGNMSEIGFCCECKLGKAKIEMPAPSPATFTISQMKALLEIRNALVNDDPTEAYRLLYELADRGRNSLTPWDEWESTMGQFADAPSPATKDTPPLESWMTREAFEWMEAALGLDAELHPYLADLIPAKAEISGLEREQWQKVVNIILRSADHADAMPQSLKDREPRKGPHSLKLRREV